MNSKTSLDINQKPKDWHAIPIIISAKELSNLFGVTEQSILNWEKAGLLHASKKRSTLLFEKTRLMIDLGIDPLVICDVMKISKDVYQEIENNAIAS